MSATGDGMPLDDGSMEGASYGDTGAAEALEAKPIPIADGPSDCSMGHDS